MGRAYLNFEDGPDGTVNVVLRAEGKIDETSPAHCAAIKLLSLFEEHAERLEDPIATIDPLSEIEQGLKTYDPLIVNAKGLG